LSNLTGQKVSQKTAKPTKNIKWLNYVRGLECVICKTYGLHQVSRTQAHHPIHDRYSFRKRDDCQAIPLCEGHHQGNFDTSKIAIHREPKRWEEEYGLDTSYSQLI
tara:strand:- start:538 stop:855 length:318 start_codon:yes stop_codon:yes gene_type:complete